MLIIGITNDFSVLHACSVLDYVGPGWVVEEDSSNNMSSTVIETKTTAEEKPDPRTVIDGFLAEISASLGKNLRLNENGICAFSCDVLTIVVEVPPASTRNLFPRVWIYSVLTEASTYKNKPFQKNRKLELAMKKNYFEQGTRSGWLSTDPNTEDLIYLYKDPVYEINATDFRNILENFIDTALQLYYDFNGKSSGEEELIVLECRNYPGPRLFDE